MDIRVGAMKPFSSTLHATLEPIGGSRFSNQRARDKLITFPDLAGPTYDEDRCRIDLSSKVVPQSAGHNTIVSSGYSVLSHSNKEISQLHGFQTSGVVSPLPIGKLEAQVSMSHTSQLSLPVTSTLHDVAQRFYPPLLTRDRKCLLV